MTPPADAPTIPTNPPPNPTNPPNPPGGPGGPGTVHQPGPGRAVGSGGYHVGIDVGGTKVLAVATQPARPTHELAAVEHPTASGPDVLAVVGRALAEVRAAVGPEAGPLLAVGVGMPGLVTHTGVLRYGPHLSGAIELDIGARLSAEYGVPVVVDNDGNCAAWAEHRVGAGAGHDDLVFVGLGTGISCGMVIGGRRVRGVHGFAGEPGHMTVLPDGPRCACDRLGCWEALASGTALAEQARRAVAEGRLDRVVQLAGGDPQAVRGEHVTLALAEGDPATVQLATTFARWVALGLANLVNLLDPAVIVLGGSVVDARAPWMTLIGRAYDDAVLAGALRPSTSLVAATAGRRAGAIGAALLAAESVPDLRRPAV